MKSSAWSGGSERPVSVWKGTARWLSSVCFLLGPALLWHWQEEEGERNVDGFVSLGIWGNLRMMSIVQLASRLRTFRDGIAGFNAALGGMGETIIESEVDGPSEDPSDDDGDTGLIRCSSGTF